ncbi:SAM-dependent methyltransferase [Paenibacillus sp. FSL M8-0228]|uniref:class I SAM-dependent methyltransferase n=1 Tax=Paenibacillus TaxID=44249 RepID=UPI00083CF8B0|nr:MULTISPECIES: SAM-dependent methyltransferase [Paenibacillus]MBO3285583.1 SAM-dependent methyltransferase [Paenibacillus polymyxa]ODB54257.1 SAM-dependent methyltransferase [Paenibacillus polymyxa]
MKESEMYLLDSLRELIYQLTTGGSLITATLSQLRKREDASFTKVQIKPVELKNKLHYQFAFHYSNKVIHENLIPDEANERMTALFEDTFRQGLLCAKDADYQVLISKKYKVSILTKSPSKSKADLSHNRKKQYVLEEGERIPFLIELGIMNEDGKVLARKYDKFRQINRFLEMVQDVLPSLPVGRPLTIVDFGCGKSYLTFALYHYLAVQQKRPLQIVGLDLKADVIEACNVLAQKLQYRQLEFLVGDIADYNELEQVDMVVTLHACDTATDAALEKAVRWGASVILSVPCCQHELFNQLENPVLEPLLSHGILKERFSALATDGIRAKLLDMMGYRTQLLEFIDMEHTPKNILIRAVKGQAGEQSVLWREYTAFRDFIHADPYLERACADLLPEGAGKKQTHS